MEYSKDGGQFSGKKKKKELKAFLTKFKVALKHFLLKKGILWLFVDGIMILNV